MEAANSETGAEMEPSKAPVLSDNMYRVGLGAIVLVLLYFDVAPALYAVCGVVLLEGLTNLRIPRLVNRLAGAADPRPSDHRHARFNTEAERVFRLTISSLMMITYSLGSDSVLWFFPWFMGFAILGAGVSGICPALALFKWLGFR